MTLSNKHTLLLLCAGLTLPDDHSDQLRKLLSRSLNWEEMLRLADARSMGPLLYAQIRKLDKEGRVPEDVMDRLKEAYHYNAARNLHLYSELRHILKVFHEKKIDALILKGAALAATVYDDIGLRSMQDIDILVNEESLPLVKEVMTALGYEAQTDVHSEAWYRECHFHLPVYLHKETLTAVEIHWKVADDSLGIDSNDWWRRAIQKEFMGVPALVPSPEDMVLHLCLHMYHNSYNKETGLRGLCDIAYTLNYFSHEANGELFRTNAARSNISKHIDSILFLFGKYLGTHYPFFIGLEQERLDPTFTAMVEQLIFGPENVSSSLFVRSLGADTVWKQCKMIFTGSFLSRNELCERYSLDPGSIKIYLYYLYRFTALAITYRKSVFDLIRLKVCNR